MRYRLSTLVLVLIFAAASVVAFGGRGVLVAACPLVILLGVLLWRIEHKAELVAVLTIVLLLIGLIVPTLTDQPRVGGGQCHSNLKQIALALLNYEHQNRCFPPAFVRGPDGKPWHSWRVLILPFMEQTPLHREYDFNEPWDGPKNRLLAEKMPYGYCCPTVPSSGGKPSLMTTYVAVTGPGTAWPGAKLRRLEDIRDDREKTILVVETADADIRWMEPRDLSLDEVLRTDAAADQPDAKNRLAGIHASYEDRKVKGSWIAMADNSTHLLPAGFDKEQFKALATVSGGETVDLPDAVVRESTWRCFRWPYVAALPIFILSLAALCWQALRRPSRPIPPQQGPQGDKEADG